MDKEDFLKEVASILGKYELHKNMDDLIACQLTFQSDGEVYIYDGEKFVVGKK